MIVKLHKQARTTPATRKEIQQATGTQAELAARYSVTIDTIRKWKSRDSVEDRPHTAHRLQTTLTPAQERVAVELRKILKLGLDDLLVVIREFLNPAVSRSGLDRCLRRHGVGSLRDLEPVTATKSSKPFKTYDPGYFHIDVKYLPQMPDETARRYLFVAIDRATRWVFVQIKPNKTAAAAKAFLNALQKATPCHIRTILTDNGSEFTDRLFNKQKQASGEHEFDQLCAALGIEHRLTKPRSPQTNGMVERFNGRISDVLATHRFESGEDLAQTLGRYVLLYNQHLPQLALQHQTPIQAMKGWQKQRPELFKKRVSNRPGLDK
ncbi:IS481 family transposase [Crenobacter sp. SG2305]|uniref:IS481 family transposase n=1 Tax=Crenobacter oryzisoli TaxID=3056844 RepID=UPI0025AAAD1C|nr:IS481 family transposase [Crenobacter sp. SG2305]MDN0085246.1 IS481 family transposase [Crenobacter sp. SG2305]